MKKIISILITCILCFFMIGCENVNYNATFYDNAKEWINEDFINDNLVFLESGSYPTERIFIVKNQDEYNEIFVEGIDEFSVDFNSQMIVVYTFATIYHRDNSLVSLEVNENSLKITYKMEKKFGVGDASRPYQRWFVVRLDKFNIDSVVFVEKD